MTAPISDALRLPGLPLENDGIRSLFDRESAAVREDWREPDCDFAPPLEFVDTERCDDLSLTTWDSTSAASDRDDAGDTDDCPEPVAEPVLNDVFAVAYEEWLRANMLRLHWEYTDSL